MIYRTGLKIKHEFLWMCYVIIKPSFRFQFRMFFWYNSHILTPHTQAAIIENTGSLQVNVHVSSTRVAVSQTSTTFSIVDVDLNHFHDI